MSEMTRCNFCTLRDLRRRGEEEGYVVELEPSDFGTRAVRVYPDGRRESAVQFWQLSDECAC